jgi:hypothetical protein
MGVLSASLVAANSQRNYLINGQQMPNEIQNK